MKTMQLRPYQNEAIEAIKSAIQRGQKRIAVEMIPQSGKGIVLAKIIEYLQESNNDKILIITGNLSIKEQISHRLSTNDNHFMKAKKECILVETEHWISNNYNEELDEYNIVIFYDASSRNVYKTFTGKEKIVIIFSTLGNDTLQADRTAKKLFTPKEVVFSYTFQEAINDGYMTPAMVAGARGPALEVFSRRLLENLGYIQVDKLDKIRDNSWDMIFQKHNQKLWVECKAYKSETVSPSIANDLLKTLVMRKMTYNISQEDIILLIVSSNIPSLQKDIIFEKYRIVVLDIENLVYYSHNNPELLRHLSQITYFPMEHIEGHPSNEARLARLFLTSNLEKYLEDTKEEVNNNEILIQRLTNCPAGKKGSREYEKICEDILRYLFESNYFNRLTSQHKTNDEHFRMDLIGSLKITQNNDNSMHPLWQMLVQHYNTHFIVFEFKNYTEQIDQNLIYITEKYLFDTALRNVAIIISRKGFSDAAKFAAEGCLKEHRKLILDINNEDLIKMLESPSENPADYLLTKLEEFLIGISK